MSKTSIPSLAEQFLSVYDAAAKDQLWKQQQEKFRSFWANRVLATTSAPLSEDECDVIIRILDVKGKGNTKDSEAVARVMVTQKGWRRIFEGLRGNQKLAVLINQIFETDDLDRKAALIDELYVANEGQISYLTGPSASTINVLIAADDPFENLTVVSLNDRRKLIEFLEIPVAFDWEKTPIGTRIVQTNRILYDGLLAAGIQGSPRTVSVFCYFEPVRALWKPEHTVKPTDESVSVTVPSVVDDEVRYWKISPGENASYWPACRDDGFIAIGWGELGDLSKMTREQFVQRRDELIKQHDWKAGGVDQAWRFSQIQVGDRIVANRGTDQVLAIGTVTGPYYFVDGEEFAHRLPVRWDDLRPRPVNEGGWRKTLIEIDREKFSEINKAPTISPRINPSYSLEDCAKDTGFDLATLQRWKRGLERKGQAIFYGPPGTGKTFIAEKLTAHLIGGTDGIRELVQFHPAYSYEDFMQGIRPETTTDGGLAYPLVPGRFMEFCKRAARCKGFCVLIIDEINRADLSRVLGELMYLLEYRNREIPLAGGGMFCIPENVRLIGTMNTAERSIALVDHALRRRFTFFPLYPDYEILSRYQQAKGFDATRLIQLLKRLNTTIADRHYEVGITFFLRDNLESQLADIWQMEIEPYLEEFFFDQRQKFELFRWEAVHPEILS